ncbi:hypothetical protein UlMin_007113 [Ulmus minor]
MASGCLSLFFADQILEKLPSLEDVEDEQLISPGLKDELGKLKNEVFAVRAAFLKAEKSRQRNKGLAAEADWYYISVLENALCSVDRKVSELFCWVRQTKKERSAVVMPMLRRKLRNTTFTNLFLTNSPSQAMKRFQMQIEGERVKLGDLLRKVFDGFDKQLDRIESGITGYSYVGGDSEGESGYGKEEDEIIQSLIPPIVRHDWQKELLKSIGKRLLFQNDDDDDPDDVAINTLRNIFYFKYSSFFYFGKPEQVNIIFPERVINDVSTRLLKIYALLPLHLKHCFDYCSLFPRDYVIEVAVLVKLWMAHGFIVHKDEHADEDVGRRYFEDLLNKGFFQQLESDELDQNKAITKCRMDSHAFALSAFASGSRYLLLRSDAENYIPWPFHVSFDFHFFKSDRGMIDPKKIRNIISPRHNSRGESVSDVLISNFASLRALELHDFGIQSLPDNIDRLKHLRYLDVSRNPDIKLLPNSITKLLNLQTLKLSSCFGLRELPKDMKNLIHLRHLEIEGCYNLRYMPPHLGHLTNLQTLSQFVLNDDVRSANDRKLCSHLEELGRLKSLRGELKIKNLSSILAKDGACKAAALGEKRHLQSLTLDWGVREGRSDQYQSQLEVLKPYRNLKGLSLTGYGGADLPSWPLSGKHVKLVKLALRRCHKLTVVSNVKLPSLKSLVLDDMVALEYLSINNLEESFPSLQELWLTELPELKGWWKAELHEKPSFRCLSKLIIQDCPKLVSMPLFPTLEEELMLDSTSLKPFQQTLELKNQASPPLSKLKNLSFVGIEELDDARARVIPWEALTSLCSLKFDHLPNLEELPRELRHLTSLQELNIWRCKMKVLPKWINNLKSLEKLAIWVCPKFKSLPQEISRLTSLKTLDIQDCPILLQRCQKETGADWHKIARIPNKRLGGNSKQEDGDDESSGMQYKLIIIISLFTNQICFNIKRNFYLFFS